MVRGIIFLTKYLEFKVILMGMETFSKETLQGGELEKWDFSIIYLKLKIRRKIQ